MKCRLILFTLLLLTVAPTLAAAPRPNILLLVADDLGYGETGCQGNREILTPHIDSIAKRGVRFTAGYVTASFCAPSRAALLTGRYQQRFGYEGNPIGKANLDPTVGLALTERTLADRLRGAGYRTGMVGKWHLGGTEKFHPQRRGFEEFFGFLHEGHFFAPTDAPGLKSFLRTNAVPAGNKLVIGDTMWSTHTGGNEPPYDADNPLLRGTNIVSEPAYLTDAFAREAAAFIERHRAEPWFLYVPFNAVHSPMQAPARDLARFRHIPDEHRRVFAAMLTSLDRSVGAILQQLRELRLEENTLVYFLSDNGGPTRELTSLNTPLSGGKGTVLEGGLRVPFLLQWPAALAGTRTFDAPVSSLDIVPTALAAAGVSAPSDPALDGVDLVPFLNGTQRGVPHETLHWRMSGHVALRHGDWKLIRAKGAANWQLFNLATDIAETNNLAASEPARLQQLIDLHERWVKEMPAGH